MIQPGAQSGYHSPPPEPQSHARSRLCPIRYSRSAGRRHKMATRASSSLLPINPEFFSAASMILFDNRMSSGHLSLTNRPILYESLVASIYALVSYVCLFFDASCTKLERQLCRPIGLSNVFMVILIAQTAIIVPGVQGASSTTPPITAGLIAHYNADSWTGTRWTDISGTGNHVTEFGGSISVARPVGGAPYIYGQTTDWIKFPANILPSVTYTLFWVARYNGETKQRIFTGLTTNWLSGFHRHTTGLKIGVASHGSCSWITQSYTTDGNTDNWVIGTDRSNSFRSNGKDRTVANTCTATANFDRLVVNTGIYGNDGTTQASDFAIQSVLVYNVKLSDANVQRVEAWLQALQPSFSPANLQVK